MEGAKSRREGAGVKSRGTTESTTAGPVSRPTMMEVGLPNLWKERGMGEQRVKGVGQESQEDGQEKDRGEEKKTGIQQMRGVSGKTDSLDGGTSSCSPPRSTSTNPQRGQSLSRPRRGRSHRRDDRVNYRPPEREWWRGPSQPKKGGQHKQQRQQRKRQKPLEGAGTGAQAAAQEQSPSQGQSLRWGRLFGSSLGSPSRAEGAEQRAKGQKTRPPSGWLSLDRSVLDLVAQTIGAGSGKKAESPATLAQTQNTPPPTSTKPTEAKQQSP
ncbi:iporin isoform X1, partial [Lates japonicus]